MLGGTVDAEDDWHMVFVDGAPRVGVQLAPNHVPPGWPDGTPQQIHIDLWVDDFNAAHEEVMALGATVLKAAEDVPPEVRDNYQSTPTPPGIRSVSAGSSTNAGGRRAMLAACQSSRPLRTHAFHRAKAPKLGFRRRELRRFAHLHRWLAGPGRRSPCRRELLDELLKSPAATLIPFWRDQCLGLAVPVRADDRLPRHRLTEDITVDGEELLEARWFTRPELAGYAADNPLGRPDSIDRHLFRAWLAGGDDLEPDATGSNLRNGASGPSAPWGDLR